MLLDDGLFARFGFVAPSMGALPSRWWTGLRVAVLVPLILGYTAWAYWVFRGKVKPESGYH